MTDYPPQELIDRFTRIDELLEIISNQLSHITGVPPELLEPKAPFNIPISMEALIQVLINSGRARGYFVIDSFDISPLTSVTYTVNVTSGYRAAPIELVALPDPDHQLQMVVYVDDNPFGYDDDMVAAIYTQPIHYLKNYYHLAYALDSIKVVFINTSPTDPATINFRFAWGEIKDADWIKIMDKYYKEVEKWLLK